VSGGTLLPEGWQAWPEPRKVELRDRMRLVRFHRVYYADPIAFTHDCIAWPDGQGPTAYQDEVISDLYTYGREAVRGPHGIGKTTIAALVLLHFSLTRDLFTDWKAPTTASNWRQLKHYLWPEVHKWARLLNWDLIGREPLREGRELQDMALDLHTGEAFAVASDKPAGIEGAHADELLYIYDEAKTVRDETFDASEGAFSGAGSDTVSKAFALGMSTPGEPVGRFYDIHTRKAGYEDWHVRHVTLDEAIEAGRISSAWAEQRKRQWGINSQLYQNRVLGEFHSSDENTVIPLEWIEAAIERWKSEAVQRISDGTWFMPDEVLPSFTAVGADIGGGEEGGDQSVLALRYGSIVAEIRKHPRGDTMETTGRIAGVLRRFERVGYAVVDGIGLGGGPVSRLRELRKAGDLRQEIRSFIASGKSDRTDATGELGFANLRAEAWWALREMLDPDTNPTTALPPDDEMIGDLTAPHWSVTSASKILIESKADIHKRIGRSTDVGDAVVMALWPGASTAARVLSPAKSSRRIPRRGGR
jgi:hypothetical protein